MWIITIIFIIQNV